MQTFFDSHVVVMAGSEMPFVSSRTPATDTMFAVVVYGLLHL